MVTIVPIGIPSRRPKFEIECLAFVTTGLLTGLMTCNSPVADSRSFGLSFPAPTPTLMTIFSSFGI